MKKNKVLSRCYLGGYFLWLFGTFLAAMMWIKMSVAATWIFAILSVLVLAAIIVSHVFYTTKREWYPIVSFAGFGLAATIELIGFILEMVNIAQGKYAFYATAMLSICLAFYILLILFLVPANLKVMKDLKKKRATIA